MNKTKLVANIGINNSNKEIIKSLIINGVDCIKIDIGYNNLDFCTDIISKVNEINKELKTYASIMLDLKGPAIRVGRIQEDKAFLKKDDKIRIYMNPLIGDNTKFSVDYDISSEVNIGNIIKIDENNIELQIIGIDKDYLLCKVLKEGILKSNKILSIENVKIDRPFLTEEDINVIKFANENNIDYISLSYVYSEEDILSVNDLLINLGNDHIQIISKIETKESVEYIDNIIKMSDGIIINKGELSNVIPIERIPGIQNKIINKCHEKGIVSLVSADFNLSDVITKIEVSDIASCVLDGVDAISLSSENIYSIEGLRTLENVIKAIEEDINYELFLENAIKTEANDMTGSLCYSVAMCANRLKCKAIFAPTISGTTAKKISRFKPTCPILAVSPNVDTVKSLTLNFGVYPVLINDLKSFDSIVEVSKKIAYDYLDLKEHDNIIVTGGYPFKKVKHTNFMKIEEL